MATLKPSWLRFGLGLGWVRLGLRLTNIIEVIENVETIWG